ncbi:uncharacterized protein LOC130523213 isoform X2 [Takifugu flavidus]|uniref:uncharacterized protein LOC130523213 isoform X2 n=1 Tax=Takifugu flavidus TaxID=433684 RepID=UPI0025447DAB|nr:uncharacterized protein LOC130523213 isoform X2 [Takifugu flavidus]
MNTDFSILKILLLLRFWGNADADISKVPTQRYRGKNASFCVEVGDAPPYDIRLTFKNNLVVNNNKTTEAYKHRVNYSEKNIELCLHNLNESDSGIYKLSVVKNQKVDDKEFHLVVQDVVPRPVIQMSALHSNLSADQCLIAVNCSVWEDWVFSVCNESVCLTSESSLRTVNLTVSAGYRSVFCIGRNDVSASNISEQMCFTDSPEPELYLYARLLTVLGLTVLGPTVILCTIFIWRAKKCTSPSIKHQREACPPQNIQPAEAETRGSVSLSHSEVTYENIIEEQSTQNHMLQGPNGSAGDGGGAEEPKNPLEVETVYSVLQKV